MLSTQVLIYISFILNIALSLYIILKDKQAISLNIMFGLFALFFLGIIPLFQYSSHQFPWGRSCSSTLILEANLLIFLFTLSYKLTYHYCFSNFFNSNYITKKSIKYSINKNESITIFLLSSIIIILLSLDYKIWEYHNGVSIQNSTLQLLVDKSLKGANVISLLAITYLWKEKQVSNKLWMLLLVLCVFVNFPTAIPRYWLATLYISLLLTIFKEKFFKLKHLFTSLFTISILVLFPLLSIFRYGIDKFFSKEWGLQKIYNFSFMGGDFDAYSSFFTTLEYVEKHGINYGKQLVTVLLFFVPRQIWPNKSIGTGALVNKLEGSDFTNFSSPLIAEGYINFGIWGILLFSIIIAFVSSKYDAYIATNNTVYNFKALFYTVFLSLFFFMQRGDLLSSFAYLTGIYISALVCSKFIFKVKMN